MKRKWVIWIIVITVVIAGGYWFIAKRKTTKKAQQYTTVKVERGDIVKTVSATGTLNPTTLVQVGSQVSGRIKEISVDYNSQVKKGQVLAQIDQASFEAQTVQAEASLTRAKVTVDDAKRTLTRVSTLFDKQLVAQSDKDTAQTSYDLAVASYKQAEANLNQMKTNLEYTTIKSPIEGVVISRNIDVGQTVAASFQSPTIFTIANDLRRMQINAAVDEADIGNIVEGQTVNFTVDAYPDDRFRGRVSQIRFSPNTVQNVVTYDVIISVFNPELKLRPGMTANVTIRTAEKYDILKISNSALRYKPSFVFGKKSGDTKSTANDNSGFNRPPRISTGTDSESRRKMFAEMKEKRKKSATDKKMSTIWMLVENKPVKMEIELGISDGKESEILNGEIEVGQDVITDEGNNKNKTTSMQGSPFMMGGSQRPRGR